MIVTEADLREQLRRPTTGAQVLLPAGARLSPAAADFVKQWSLVAVEGDPAEPREAPGAAAGSAGAGWDKASVFPVSVTSDAPCCTTCGTALASKPSALTQLNAHHFTPKTHPRIKLRGRVDSLHAVVLLTQRLARQAGEASLECDLGTVAAYCRELMSAEYNERPVAEPCLRDHDAETIHRATHDPAAVLGIQHLTISSADPELQHWLNVARTTARELEILALETFGSPHHPYGASICHGLNRLSSVLYFLQLLLAKGEERC